MGSKAGPSSTVMVAKAVGVKMKDFAAIPKTKVIGKSDTGDALCAAATDGMLLKWVARYTGNRDAIDA